MRSGAIAAWSALCGFLRGFVGLASTAAAPYRDASPSAEPTPAEARAALCRHAATRRSCC